MSLQKYCHLLLCIFLSGQVEEKNLHRSWCCLSRCFFVFYGHEQGVQRVIRWAPRYKLVSYKLHLKGFAISHLFGGRWSVFCSQKLNFEHFEAQTPMFFSSPRASSLVLNVEKWHPIEYNELEKNCCYTEGQKKFLHFIIQIKNFFFVFSSSCCSAFSLKNNSLKIFNQ